MHILSRKKCTSVRGLLPCGTFGCGLCILLESAVSRKVVGLTRQRHGVVHVSLAGLEIGYRDIEH